MDDQSDARVQQSRSSPSSISHLVHLYGVQVDEQADARVQQLEKQLTVALAERDDLARDVENLCMQSGSSIFDGSMVLSERIFSAEKELSQVKVQVGCLTATHSCCH